MQRQSNYDQMRDEMARKITACDLRPAIARFGLRTDADCLYIRFIGLDYRMPFATGLPERIEDGFRTARIASYNEAMTIYDILGYAKPDCRLSGRFVALGALKGIVQSASSGSDMFAGSAKFFDDRIGALRCACEAMGGTPSASATSPTGCRCSTFCPSYSSSGHRTTSSRRRFNFSGMKISATSCTMRPHSLPQARC